MSDSVPKSTALKEGSGRIPAKIGRYEVMERLGSGSAGTVYRATDPLIGRILAIKSFRVDLPAGPERDRFLQRFYHEARISGGLGHPNIVALFDVGETDGLPYLVFEHVEGPTLEIALARAGRLDAAETIRVVEQVAAALDFAHARGVVHRDIRPANIILATDKRVRVADFGIARVEGSQLTQHGEILGTPAYMSPEQIRGYELSAGSDLFSLAVCAYEMLSGQRPFNGRDQAEMLEALVYSPPTEPKELRSLGIPSREFMFVFERALAKDPAHRFPDGVSFARALKSCLGVVVAGEDPVPVTRIAVPPPPPPPKRSILPPVAPPAPKPSPASAPFDTSATASVDPGSRGSATSITESGDKSVPHDLSADSTLVSPLSFDQTLVSPKASTSGSADATMVSPLKGSTSASADATMVSPLHDGESPAPRLSRQAVENFLSKSSPAAPSPVLQKTLPGSEKAPVQPTAPAFDDIPPTREMPKLSVSPSLSASRPGRESPGDTLHDASHSSSRIGPSDKTVIMTDTEKSAAAKLRVPDRSVPKAPPPSPPITRAQPNPSPTHPGSTARPPRPASPPSMAVQQIPKAAPSSMATKVLLGAVVLLILMAVAVGAILWGQSRQGGAQTVEKWNDLPVYRESEVEKSPLPFSIDIPKPTLEPGRVVSITVSWIVTPEGMVDDPKIVVSASPEIDAFVVEGIRKWRYEPGQKDGKTVPVRVLRKYTFPPRGSSQGF